MNKKITAISLVLILSSIALCGCTDYDIATTLPSPRNKMKVTVQASVKVEEYDSLMSTYKPVPNKTVNFQITKTSGETFTFQEVTDQDGYAECSEVGYNLYEKQAITVYYSADGITDLKTLTFNTIYDENVADQTYAWSPHGVLRIIG